MITKIKKIQNAQFSISQKLLPGMLKSVFTVLTELSFLLIANNQSYLGVFNTWADGPCSTCLNLRVLVLQ